MNVRSNSEDASNEIVYEQQIEETDMLGNELLAGFFAAKIAENKKKIVNKLNIFGDYSSYKAGLDKLKSLNVATVHKILEINEKNDLLVQMYAAEKLLTKIEEILNTRVKYSANAVVSREEIVQLKNHMNVLQTLKEAVKDIPSTAESKLQKAEEFCSSLKQIVEFIESTSAKLNESQVSIVKDSSNVLE